MVGSQSRRVRVLRSESGRSFVGIFSLNFFSNNMSRYSSTEQMRDAWSGRGGEGARNTNRPSPKICYTNEAIYNIPANIYQGLQRNPISRQPQMPVPASVGPIDRFVSRTPNTAKQSRYEPYSRFERKFEESKFKAPQPVNHPQKFIPISKNTKNPENRVKIKDVNTPVAFPVTSRMIFLTGTVDHVIRWAKLLKNCRNSPDIVFYETVGVLENYYSRGMMKLLFIRGNATGVLQGIFYTIDYNIPDFAIGSTVSVIGRMVGSNKMRVETAAVVASQEMPGVHKMSFMCQRTVEEIIKTED